MDLRKRWRLDEDSALQKSDNGLRWCIFAIIDGYSRYVVGWSVSSTMTAQCIKPEAISGRD